MGCDQPFQTTANNMSNTGVPGSQSTQAAPVFGSPEFDAQFEQHIRAIAPLENYGYKRLYLSNKHGLREVFGRGVVVTGDACIHYGYNCVDINYKIVQELRQMGQKAFLSEGADEKGYFGQHYYAVVDGTVYDGVGLFPFKGAAHKTRVRKSKEKGGKYIINNPIEVISLDTGESCMVGFSDLYCYNSLVSLQMDCWTPSSKAVSYSLTASVPSFREKIGPDDFDRITGDNAQPVFEELCQMGIIRNQVLRDRNAHTPQDDRLEGVLQREQSVVLAAIHKMAYPGRYPSNYVGQDV